MCTQFHVYLLGQHFMLIMAHNQLPVTWWISTLCALLVVLVKPSKQLATQCMAGPLRDLAFSRELHPSLDI